MKKDLEQVKEFHKSFNHPVLETPQIPGEDRCNLRVSLLQEELDELKEAIKNKDIVEIADAIADIQYVLNGAALEFGLGNIFEELNDEVHRSNMSKACNTEREAIETMLRYEEKGENAYWVNRDGKYFIYRYRDNKGLKSINYSPADLKSIVNK